jgi:type IV fimbrial biogenesis protein FimT
MGKGFTLLELLISTSISALLLLIIPPSLQRLIAHTECEYNTYSIQNALNSARNHAIAINERVVACMADENNNCSSFNATHFIIFIDKNIDNKLTLTNTPDSDIILLSEDNISSSIKINSNRQEYTFQADGSIAGTPGTIRICNQIDMKDNFRIIIAMSGRVRRQAEEQC